jgi:lysophospholipase L1-like esterase
VWRRALTVIAAVALVGCGEGPEKDEPAVDSGAMSARPDGGSDTTSASADARGDAAGAPADAKAPADAAPPASVRFIGRVDRSDPAGPRFSWPGTSIVARFSGPSVAVRLRDPGNFFQVVLDGMPLPVLAASSGKESYPIAANLGAGPHELLLHRRTEAFVGETQFLGLVLDSGGALLVPPPPPARRLELVGDSITCGYGIEGADMSCPFTPATENHYLAFGALAARALQAESISIAFSGKGMYRNLGGDTGDTMPMLYDRIIVDRAARWDFSGWIPDAVVINLGTNDFGMGDPGPGYRDAYRAFLQRVRGNYPKAQIVCTLGPMMNATQIARARMYLMPVLDEARAGGDLRVAYLEFPTQDGSTGFGCDWHPSKGTNQAMADQLVAELRRLLGW